MNLEKSEKKEKESLYIFVLSLMYFVASLGVLKREILSSGSIITIKYVVILLGGIFFFIKYINKFSRGKGVIGIPNKMQSINLFFCWILFSISVILSQALNGVVPLEGMAYLFFTPLVFFLIIPQTLFNAESVILKAAFYSSFVYLLLSGLSEPIVFGRYYAGITYNPNSLGQLAVQSSIASLCLFLYSIKNIKNEKKRSVIYFICLLISFFFILVSRSRTSFISFLIPCFLVLFVFFIGSKVKKRKLIIPSIVLIILYFWKLKDFFQISILDKFEKNSAENLLSGRNYIWNVILDDISLLGHGSDYLSNVIGRGAHNSILEIVAIFGAIAGVFILLFFIFSIISSLRYALLFDKNNYFFVPLGIVTSFILLGLAESMFGVIGKSMTLVYLNTIGILIFKRREKIN